MTTERHPEKPVDLPPKGARNPDPITGAARLPSHRDGRRGRSRGCCQRHRRRAVAGPVGAAVGAAAGAVAGGLAGKGIGELIDPTTEDNWLRDHFKSRPYVEKGDDFEHFSRRVSLRGLGRVEVR